MGWSFPRAPRLAALALLGALVAGCASDEYGGEVVQVEFTFRYEGVEKAGELPDGVSPEAHDAPEAWLMTTATWIGKDGRGPRSHAWDSALEPAPSADQVRALREALAVPGVEHFTLPDTREVETKEHYWVVLHGGVLFQERFNPFTKDSRTQVVRFQVPKP